MGRKEDSWRRKAAVRAKVMFYVLITVLKRSRKQKGFSPVSPTCLKLSGILRVFHVR